MIKSSAVQAQRGGVKSEGGGGGGTEEGRDEGKAECFSFFRKNDNAGNDKYKPTHSIRLPSPLPPLFTRPPPLLLLVPQVAAGKTEYQMEEQLNWTAHRSRGYGVGSLKQKSGEPDRFWVQPGHALAEKGMSKAKGGRFEVRCGGEGEGGVKEEEEE